MNISPHYVIQICRNQKEPFLEVAQSVPYQLKGIFNSEMLLFCAFTKHLGFHHIIESGRARGNSTEILARYFENSPSVLIHSVELLKYTEDSLIAMQRLYNTDSKSNSDLTAGVTQKREIFPR